MRTPFLAQFIFSFICLNGMSRIQTLHPKFTIEEANKIHNFLRKELNDLALTVDFPHLLTPYFLSQNSKSFGFHFANSPEAQKIITSHDIDLINGCYQGQFVFGDRLYMSTFFPDSWSYKDFAGCLLSVLKYGSKSCDPRNKKRQVFKGTYKDTFGKTIEALLVFDKFNKRVVAAYPIVISPEITNRSKKFYQYK